MKSSSTARPPLLFDPSTVTLHAMRTNDRPAHRPALSAPLESIAGYPHRMLKHIRREHKKGSHHLTFAEHATDKE